VTELANSVVGTLMGLVSTAYSMASAVGGAIGSGLKAGIEGMIDEVIGAAQGLLDAATGILSHVPGFSPIEHVGKYFGGQLGGGFAKGIEAMERRVGGASDALVAAAMAPLDASVSTSGGIGAALGGASSGNTYVSISLKSQELIDLIRNAEAGGSFAMNFGSELGLYTGTP
jgi:phage-related protein